MIYGLFMLGGVAALIYEVMWMRSFSLVFGSSTRSAAAVLAAYFGGMALGNWLGGHFSRRGHGLALYGWCEIAIGATALLVGPWLSLYASFYPSIYGSLQDSPLLFGTAKLLLAAVSLGPPVVAMGATLPFIVSAMVTREGGAAGRTGLLYGLNTLGATVGALVGGLVLPWSLGARGSIFLAAAINFLVGTAAIFLSRSMRRQAEVARGGPSHASVPADPARPARPPLSILTAAAVSGLGTLALEVIHVRLISHRSDSSIYAFSLLLAVYLVVLAGGCLAVSRILDRWNPWRILAWTQSLGVVAILLSPIVLQGLPTSLFYAGQGAFGVHLTRLAAAMLLVLGPPVFLMGMVLPATWKLATTRLADVGCRVGTLTSVNTIAAVIGSLVAGFVLLPLVGVDGAILIIAGAYVFLAALSFFRGYGGVLRFAGAAAGVFLLLWIAAGVWRLDLVKLDAGGKLVRYEAGEGANLAIIENADGNRSMVVNERYTLGASGSLEIELRQGRVPLVLHPAPKRVAYIGVATGITVSAFMDFPTVERCVAVELLPGVMAALPDFDRWNRRLASDPRVELLVEDGRNFLQGTTETFDIIVGDLFAPWNAGVAYLYTVEQFENARGRLAEGGLFVQWFPGHQLAVEDLRTITASFLRVFPDATLWRRDFETGAPIVALVGYRDGARFDEAAVSAHALRLATQPGPPAPLLGRTTGTKMLYVCGPAELGRWTTGAPLNTDDRPIVEFSTSRNLQTMGVKSFALATVEFLGSIRPRTWSYEPAPADLERIMAGADRVHDATAAAARGTSDSEVSAWTAAIPLVGDVPYVAERIVATAARLYRAGNAAGSEALLRSLTQLDPPPASAFFALGMMRKDAGDTSAAVGMLERAVQLEPARLGVRRDLVAMLTATGRFDAAEPHQRALVAAIPGDGRLRAEFALTLHKLGRSEDARQEIESLVRSTAPQSREALAQLLISLGLDGYLRPAAPR